MSETIEIGGEEVVVRAIEGGDLPALAAFAASMPVHDLLFLARDIRQRRVIQTWLAGAEAGEIDSLVGLVEGTVVATTANLRDAQSWSPHVCEIRLLVASAWRGRGLGRVLLDRAVAAACAAGATKLTARMTPDQAGAITLFEESGFRAEALLRDHVRDADGKLHDLALLALDPTREAGRRAAFGES